MDNQLEDQISINLVNNLQIYLALLNDSHFLELRKAIYTKDHILYKILNQSEMILKALTSFKVLINLHVLYNKQNNLFKKA